MLRCFGREEFKLSSAEVIQLEQTSTKTVKIFDYSGTIMERKECGIGYAHHVE